MQYDQLKDYSDNKQRKINTKCFHVTIWFTSCFHRATKNSLSSIYRAHIKVGQKWISGCYLILYGDLYPVETGNEGGTCYSSQ